MALPQAKVVSVTKTPVGIAREAIAQAKATGDKAQISQAYGQLSKAIQGARNVVYSPEKPTQEQLIKAGVTPGSTVTQTTFLGDKGLPETIYSVKPSEAQTIAKAAAEKVSTAAGIVQQVSKTVFPQPSAARQLEAQRVARSRIEQYNQLGRIQMFGGKPYTELTPIERRGTAQITSRIPYTDEELVGGIKSIPDKAALDAYAQRLQDRLNSQAKDLQQQVDDGKISISSANETLQKQADKNNELLATAARTKNIQSALLRAPAVAVGSMGAVLLLPAAVSTAIGLTGLGGLTYNIGKDVYQYKKGELAGKDLVNNLEVMGIDTAAALTGGLIASRLGVKGASPKIAKEELTTAKIEPLAGKVKLEFLTDVNNQLKTEFGPQTIKNIGKIADITSNRITLSDGRVYDIATITNLRGLPSTQFKGGSLVFGRQVLPGGKIGETLLGRSASILVEGKGESYSKIIRARVPNSLKEQVLVRLGFKKVAGREYEILEKSKGETRALTEKLKATTIKSQARLLSEKAISRELSYRISSILNKAKSGSKITPNEVKNLINLERRLNRLKPYTDTEWKASKEATLTYEQILEIADKLKMKVSKPTTKITTLEGKPSLGLLSRIKLKTIKKEGITRTKLSQSMLKIGRGYGLKAPKAIVPKPRVPSAPAFKRLIEFTKVKESPFLKEVKRNILEEKIIRENRGLAQVFEKKEAQAVKLKTSKPLTKTITASVVKAISKPLEGEGKPLMVGGRGLAYLPSPSLAPKEETVFGVKLGKTPTGELKIETGYKGELKSSGAFKSKLETGLKTESQKRTGMREGTALRSELSTKPATELQSRQAMRQRLELQTKSALRSRTREATELRLRTKAFPSFPKSKVQTGRRPLSPFKISKSAKLSKKAIKSRFERQALLRSERPSRSPLNVIVGREFNPRRYGLLKVSLAKKYESKFKYGKALLKTGKITRLKTI